MKDQSRRFWEEFKKFALKGSVVDLSIGIIIGSALTAITNSLVKDIIMPPLGLLLRGVDFSNLFIDLSGQEYQTLAQAQAAGVPTINYGLFLNAILNFLIIALVIFIVIKQMSRLQRRSEAVTEKPCRYCYSQVHVAATRCPHCTSALTAEYE